MNSYFRTLTSSLGSAAKTLQEKYTQGRQYTFGDILVEEVALIAEGGFGFIYLCRELNSSEPQYVVKKLHCQDKERLNLALREVEVYERIGSHPNIVRYFGSVVEQIDTRSKEVNILFEYLPNGHLLDLLNNNSGLLRESVIVKILVDVSKGLSHLHKCNIQNRDIKIENIMQASDGRWVLVDLGSWSEVTGNSRGGLAQMEEEIERFTTMMYRSPEMVDLYKGFPIGTKSDMWSLGCVLATLMHNKHPFQDESKLAIANARFHLDSAVFSRFSHNLIDLLFLLLAENPDDRPSATQLLEILGNWSNHSYTALPLPKAVKDRIEKVFKIHGVARKTRPAPVVPVPQQEDDNWAQFPDSPVGAPQEAAVDWTAEFDAAPRQTKATVDLLDWL